MNQSYVSNKIQLVKRKRENVVIFDEVRLKIV